MEGKIPSESPSSRAPRPTHSPVYFLSICGLIRDKKKVFLASLCQGLPGAIGLFHSSPLLLACQPHILPAATKRKKKLQGGCLSDIIHRQSGTVVEVKWIHRLWDPFHLIMVPFELFNTNAELLVFVGGGGLSGINEGRWGKNITVQIRPWVLNFKNGMHYSWLITSGSDCMNTNCKWWGTDKLTTNTTQIRCKYIY